MTFQINLRVPSSCPCQAEVGGQTRGGRRYSAFVNVNPAVTDLKQAMSDEIGHTFGLADCDYCAAGISAMTRGASMNDTTLGIESPSSYDNTAARPYYVSPGSRGGRTSSATSSNTAPRCVTRRTHSSAAGHGTCSLSFRNNQTT